MVALFTVSIFFACDSEEVSPINPSAPRLFSGTNDAVDQDFQDYIEEFNRDLSEGAN